MKKTGWLILALGFLASGCNTGKDKDKIRVEQERLPLTAQQRDRLLAEVVAIQGKTDAHKAAEVKRDFNRVKQDFPQIAKLDLGLFAKAEVYLARAKLAKATVHYRRLVKNYPDSELHGPSAKRLFEIGKTYLSGIVVWNFGLFRTYGYDRGVAALDGLSEELGLEDPNGLGVQAALLVAKHHETRMDYDEAYLKWQEIATQWEAGPIGMEALLGMGRSKLAAYNKEIPARRHMFDSSRLTTARTYYDRFRKLYPKEAQGLQVDHIIDQIDQQLAYQQFCVGQYYQRTRHPEAATKYFTYVAETWPSTPAAQMAKDALGKGKTP